MKKKIVILTNNAPALQFIQEDLMTSNYEVMVSESCLDEVMNGQFEFIQRFDLIVLDQLIYSELPSDIYASLLSLGKPLMILSGDRESIKEGENDYTLMYVTVTYPVTKASLKGHIDVLLDNTSSFTTQELPVRSDENVFVAQARTARDDDKLGVYRAFAPTDFSREYVTSVETREDTKVTDNYEFEIANHNLVIDGYPILLSPKELELFECLSSHNHRLVSNEELFETIWGKEYQVSKQPFLSNLVMKIRKKVCDEYGVLDSIIINRKGVGYKLNDKFVQKPARS
jgi:DNA-binding response OmpR family regulator